MVKSIVEKDGKDMVNYLGAAKLLSEVLKRMYLTHEKRREFAEEITEMEKEMGAETESKGLGLYEGEKKAEEGTQQ